MFYLGTHHPAWLAQTDVPLFVSHRTIGKLHSPPRSLGPWALDSGGFSELSLYGEWRTPPSEYVATVRRLRDEVGNLQWAAIQDWMCEAEILARTGLTILEHQTRTVANLLELRSLAPDLPWTPVIQGWTEGQYLDHVDMYAAAGVDLFAEPLVGIGSVCRRQATLRAEMIVRGLATDGLRLHGFGFKVRGLEQVGGALVSADSLAWSVGGRYRAPIPGHDKPGPGRPRGHKKCQNCIEYALEWRTELVERGIIREAA